MAVACLVTDSYSWKVFGEPIQSGSGTDNPYGYIADGLYYTELVDLINAWNNWLKASIGRWNSRDKLGFDSGDPNPYRCVGNNPLTMFDPLGLFCSEPLIPKACQSASGKWKTCKQICKDASIDPLFKKRVGYQKSPGMVVCCGTQACACLFTFPAGNNEGGTPVTYVPGQCPSLDGCINKHENTHISLRNRCNDARAGLYPAEFDENETNDEECALRCRSIGCMQAVLRKKTPPSTKCLDVYEIFSRQLRNWVTNNCSSTIPNVADCNDASGKFPLPK